MSKHTSGKWEVRPSSNPKNGTGWRDIVSTGGAFSPAYVGEALEKDARLIAAAPEMLQALKKIYSDLAVKTDPVFGSSHEWEKAREYVAHVLSHELTAIQAVINKAENK